MKKSEFIMLVERLAIKNEREYGGCSQCVVAAFKESTDRISDDVFKAATGLAGGIGITGKTCCGAITGGIMVLSTYLGREYNNFKDPNKIRFETFKMSKELVNRFEAEYGTVVCDEIKKKIMGRTFNLWDEKEYEEFLAAGGHDDKCPLVCGNAAKWVAEILVEKELI